MSPQHLLDKIRTEARSTAERKVASVLLEGYPTRALTTVDALAKQASVSAPTVLRFLSKIGFARFADFQAAVIIDVERQLGSPLTNLQNGSPADTPDHIYQKTLMLQAESLRTAAAQAMPAEFDVVANYLANPKLSVKTVGGRYSQNLAQRLAALLKQVRPGVTFQPYQAGFFFDSLVDAGSQDIFVMFDYRRYQPDLLHFARGVRAAGAKICLLTDTWRSPIAEYAEAILTAPDSSTSPFGSSVVAMAQVEALIAAVVLRRREDSRDRLARIEELRQLGQPGAKNTQKNEG
ncbi:MurR/RpiR family transcriptional regulator [Rhodobacter lacus]|uniref:MurR/RpiR family transcriptional regulator n=1 Tax=Rhodobacter lacus TaxID=1641972 RepID=A0ABW5A9P8_9RHOB